MTIKVLLHRRYRITPESVLAKDQLNAMRYEALRGISVEQFAAIQRSAILNQEHDEDFGAAFNRLVDKLVLTQHAQEKEHV